MPSMIRPALLAALLLSGPVVRAQTAPFTPADSALVYAILTAEDRRDTTAAVLVDGERHPDARINLLARRARGRIADSQFTARREFPAAGPRVTWPYPAWRPRFDSLRPRRTDCVALQAALSDTAWQVRLRAADLVPPTCASNDSLVAILRHWVDVIPTSDRRTSDGVSWHAGAHGIGALARLRPVEAKGRLSALITHPLWQVRMYAAVAAAALTDTTLLRRLVRDRDDNVKEAAIDALSRLTGHADDSLYLAALNASGAQAVRAAATALKGSTHPDAPRRLDRALRRWLTRPNDSERDARLALLAAAGRPVTEDRRFITPAPLPADAVALALGADIRLRVTMDPASGGGSFIVRLRGDAAPITSARILQLVRQRFYDTRTWHRVIPDFVIQGGSPGASEYVGFPRFFRDELGPLSHLRGGVGMSTRGHDTGDAQWFVDLSDLPRLDRDYTLFGEVIEGMAVVDGILEGDRILTIRPVE
jgi:cyclophilin family peptidyl-prolyl cis-trans isomerase